MHRDEQRFVLGALGLVLVGIILAIIFFGRVETKTVTKTVYRDHPKGLIERPELNVIEETAVPGITLVCEVWGTKGFDPRTSAAKEGQRLVSDCEMVKVGPVG